MANALQQLAAAGVAVWLDDLSRARIQSGELARMVEHDGIVGITTNPTIFAKAIGSGPGGYLRGLTAKAAANQFSTSPMVMALLRRQAEPRTPLRI